MTDMLLATTPDLPGYRIVEVFGLVRGNAVRARDVTDDILAGLKNLVGGEVIQYRKLLAESREQALDQMVCEAGDLGANAIVAVQMSTSLIARGLAEILLFGTAVRAEPG